MDNKTRSKTKAIVIALSICAGIVIVGVIAFFQYQKSVISQRIVEEVKIEMTENSEDAKEEVAKAAENQINEQSEEPEEPGIAETEESGTLYTVESTVMYKLPDENQDAYVYLPMGCEVEVLAKTENGYTKVQYGLKKGYLKNELLTAEAPEIPERDDEQTAETQQAEEKSNDGDTSTPAMHNPTAEQQEATVAQQQAATAANASQPTAPVEVAPGFVYDPTDWWNPGDMDTGYADFN